MPYMPDNPTNLTPTQRRQEIAAILGRGLIRRRTACNVEPAACSPAPESATQKALDVSVPGDPHVSWLTGPRT
jgi:hypothetical protein